MPTHTPDHRRFDALGDPAASPNDGFMKITARADGGAITSARMRTAVDRLAWQPTDKASKLRVSARIKLPAGAARAGRGGAGRGGAGFGGGPGPMGCMAECFAGVHEARGRPRARRMQA